MVLKTIFAISKPQSYVTEAYKILRTSIDYMNIDDKNQVLMITSSIPGEGKTTTICNLAVTIAQMNKKVLLVDCDTRRPKVHELFNIKRSPGVTNVLAEKRLVSEVVQPIDEINGLFVLTAGPLSPSPSELFASAAFEALMVGLRGEYDVILLDVPPILSVADSSVISKRADAIILVTAMNMISKETLMNSKKTLDNINAKVIGTVLTRVKVSKNNGYYENDYYKTNKARLGKKR